MFVAHAKKNTTSSGRAGGAPRGLRSRRQATDSQSEGREAHLPCRWSMRIFAVGPEDAGFCPVIN
jgi:hypothetical protein